MILIHVSPALLRKRGWKVFLAAPLIVDFSPLKVALAQIQNLVGDNERQVSVDADNFAEGRKMDCLEFALHASKAISDANFSEERENTQEEGGTMESSRMSYAE
ncbi:hypothetical protein Ancab_008587 [Ancistrocladus abbreviatus]